MLYKELGDRNGDGGRLGFKQSFIFALRPLMNTPFPHATCRGVSCRRTVLLQHGKTGQNWCCVT